MNRLHEFLMDKPSLKSDRCEFCGRPKGSDHHIVPRSQGGTNGPTISVCGYGNESGCHGLLHSHRLHLWWDTESDQWIYLYTIEPTKMQNAIEMVGWQPLHRRSYR